MSRKRAPQQDEPTRRSESPTRNPWPAEYVKTPDTYIWGTEPSLLAREIVELLPPGARVLDLGSGEGRDSVFFATQGFVVTGVETSPAGLEKARRLAEARAVSIRWIHAAMPEIPVADSFDLIYSCGSIHYVPRGERPRFYRRLRALTATGGLHAHVVFTDALIYREMGEIIDYFRPGELADVYADWLVLRREDGLIACARDGSRHVHSVDVVLAQNERPRSDHSAASRGEAGQWTEAGWRRPQHSLFL